MSRRLVAFLAGVTAALGQSAHENLNAVLWIQTAAEKRALAVQTYRAAERQLLAALKDPNWTAALEQTGDYQKLPPAVILDLDETVLDNSAIMARLVLEKNSFSEAAWARWINERRAPAIPGAVDFLKVAHANGVAVFYVTNRVCDPTKTDDPTADVLRSLSLPFSPHRLFCRTGSADKSSRRQRIAGNHRVLLLIGDDLNDFVTLSDRATVEARRTLTAAHDRYWGDRWFVLPNPMYGSWERAVGKKLEGLRP
jgi:acid phosphatase